MADIETLKNLNITVEVVNGETLFRFIGGLADGIRVKILPETSTETKDGISLEYIALAVPDDPDIKAEIETRLSQMVNLVLKDYIAYLDRENSNENSV